MSGQPYCVWCNQTGHPATVECHAAYKKRLEPTDIVERLRTKHVFGAREIDQQRQDAADLIESLRAKLREAEEEVAEWKQAASVEAGLRREFATQVEGLRTALQKISNTYAGTHGYRARRIADDALALTSTELQR
jgi:hypothetical protein